MPKLSWDSFVEDRYYEIGVDRVAISPTEELVVPWSGVVSIEEGSTNSEALPLYQNGMVVHNYLNSMEYQTVISALTYPEEFESIADDYPAPLFSLTYRTDISDVGYKLHLVYNCQVHTGTQTYTTMSNSPEATLFQWGLISRPSLEQDGLAEGSHLIIDSRLADPKGLSKIEDILYGTQSSDPTFITPFEVRYLLGGMPPQEIVPDYETGLSDIIETVIHRDLIGNQYIGLYRKPYETRLVNRDLPPGFFRLE